ncbi:hypothetical protein D3C75_1037360 [compost metagenome]
MAPAQDQRAVDRSFSIPASHFFSGCGIDCNSDDGSIRHNNIAAVLYAGCDEVDSIRDRPASNARQPFERAADAGVGEIIR